MEMVDAYTRNKAEKMYEAIYEDQVRRQFAITLAEHDLLLTICEAIQKNPNFAYHTIFAIVASIANLKECSLSHNIANALNEDTLSEAITLLHGATHLGIGNGIQDYKDALKKGVGH